MIPQRIVAIGASSFFGLGDPLHGGYIGRLKVWHETKDENNTVFNLGISGKVVGETSSMMVQRIYSEAKVREPDLILLIAGINDIRRHGSKESPSITSPENYRKNVEKMIENARLLAPVIMISPIPIKEKHDSQDNYLLPEDVKEYTHIVKDVCDKEKVPYLNIHDEWAKEDYLHLLTPDGVHANEKGHERIFQRLKDFLEDLYR